MIPTFYILLNATKPTISSADPTVSGKYCFSPPALTGFIQWKTFHNLDLLPMKPDSSWFFYDVHLHGNYPLINEALRKLWALFLF